MQKHNFPTLHSMKMRQCLFYARTAKEQRLRVFTVAVTAIVVSLDSFMAGFSLSLNKRADCTLPSAVALISLLLCLLTSFAGMALAAHRPGFNVLARRHRLIPPQGDIRCTAADRGARPPLWPGSGPQGD